MATPPPAFDLQAAHQYFAKVCFNKAWEMIDKPNRTQEEDELMLSFTHTSHWHWTQVERKTTKNISIALWQISRVYAILGQGENSLRYAEACLRETMQDAAIEPFYICYAYEALARAAGVASNIGAMNKYLEKAKEYAQKVVDPESRGWIENDLNSINLAAADNVRQVKADPLNPQALGPAYAQ